MAERRQVVHVVGDQRTRGDGRRPGLNERDIVLVSVGGEPCHVRACAGIVGPDGAADVVGSPLQDLRDEVRVARAVRDRGLGGL